MIESSTSSESCDVNRRMGVETSTQTGDAATDAATGATTDAKADATTDALFRPEALAHRAFAHLGPTRLPQQPLFNALTVAGLVLVLAALLFLCLAGHVRKVTVPGLIGSPTGSVQVLATAGGVVEAVRVSEGARVAGGAVLLTLRTGRATRDGATGGLIAERIADRLDALDAEITARDRQTQVRQTALRARLDNLQRELCQLADESAALHRRHELVRQSAQRHEALAREGFISSHQLQQRVEEQMEAHGRLLAAARVRTALERELLDTRAELAAGSAQRQVDQAQYERQRASLAQEFADNEERRQVVVSAPRDAVVTALTATSGRAVREGEPLMTLMPVASRDDASLDAALSAELFAPSRAIGFVAVGQSVRLRLAAFPYQKFGMPRGRVTAVSATPLEPQELPPGHAAALMQAAHAQEPLYRIKVALDRDAVDAYGHPVAMRPGMALEADIQQERRALWEWLFEPLLAAGRKV